MIFPLFFTSCNPLYEGDEEARLSINLPPITNQSRSISGERVEALQKTTASYRVTVNKVTREGTGTSYTFTLPVGARANVTVECLNSSGEVIVRAEKSHLVTAGENSVRISLKNDGNEIINTGLYYSYGDAAAGGVATGLPSGRKIEVGGKFTVDDGSAMTWEHAEASAGSGGSGFTGWKTNVALTGDTDTQTPDAQAGGDVQLGGTYIMPDGNVTLAAQWNKKKYSLSYNDNIPTNAAPGASVSGKPADTNPQDAFSKVAVGSETPTLNAQGQQWTFKYWTLTPADSGTQYRTGQQITLTGNITLYAQWTNESVWRVDFAEPATKPSAYTANMPQGNVVKQGQPFSWTNPAASGWTFEGWDVTGSGTISSPLSATTTQITPDADVTLTAKWTANTYKVNYNANKGTGSVAQTDRTYGQAFTLAAGTGLSRAGYTFVGWAKADDATAKDFDGSGNVPANDAYATTASDVTFYAVWQGELKSVPQVGDIIMNDGTLRTKDNIGADTANAIAIVCQVSNGVAKAVGKNMTSTKWCISAAKGSSISCINLGYGADKLAALRNIVNDAGDNVLATNYPAWDYACNYGKNAATNAGIPASMQDGWYLPEFNSELYCIKDNKTLINDALIALGSSTKFDSRYFSTTQVTTETNYYNVHCIQFATDTSDTYSKINNAGVCAMRDFTY